MGERGEGFKITRRGLFNTVKAVGIAVGLGWLASKLPYEKQALSQATSPPKEKPTPPLTNKEEKNIAAITQITKEKEAEDKTEEHRRKLEKMFRAYGLPADVNPINPNEAMYTIQIVSPKNKRRTLRNLPVDNEQTKTGDFIDDGIIIQGILFLVSYRNPQKNNEFTIWGATRPDLLSRYSLIEMEDRNKALEVDNQRYVFICLQEGNTKYYQYARTKP